MNVLLLSDFSKVGINAIHYAMDLLQDQQANFYLLNIYDPDPECIDNCAEDEKAMTLATLEERVQKLQQRSENRPHKVTGHYSEEKLVNAAREFVKKHRIDLIVMGAVGHEQRHSTILGKHTFEIMSKIKCNTLAVAHESEFKKPERLLMPLDYNASFGSKNIRFLKDSEVFKGKHLDIWEIPSVENFGDDRNIGKKEIFSRLKNIRVNFSTFVESSVYDKTTWADVQNKFDHIVILGKNIRICDLLLHNKDGLYAKVPNQLPILVLHD
ncbi:universal stress protein [Salinimicrobium sp. ASW11-47]|nr:universal stress protein [Salinimicrobium sediminilitoris]